jgi:hypothetical protein
MPHYDDHHKIGVISIFISFVLALGCISVYFV